MNFICMNLHVWNDIFCILMRMWSESLSVSVPERLIFQMINQSLVPHGVCASPLETGTACSHETICSELDQTPINGSAARKHHNDIWQPPSPPRLERSETHPVIHYRPVYRQQFYYE